MNEFLNPKSMLTPGVAGSLMMFLVNGIGCQFPELSMRYIALLLSFLIGSVVWFSELEGRAPMLQKGIYWVLNSLVIFVVGFGTANLAADATAQAPPEPAHVLNLLRPQSCVRRPACNHNRDCHEHFPGTTASPCRTSGQGKSRK